MAAHSSWANLRSQLLVLTSYAAAGVSPWRCVRLLTRSGLCRDHENAIGVALMSHSSRVHMPCLLILRSGLMIAAGVALAWLAWTRLMPDPLAAGLRAYEQRAWGRAEAEASERLKARPSDREALRLPARAKGRQGRDVEAQTIYRQRLGFESMTAEDFVVAASGLRRKGLYDQARISLERAQKFEPDYPEMLHDLASLDATTGRLAEGTELAERLICRPGWDVKALLLLANLREQLDDPAGTVEALELALQRDLALAAADFSVSTVQKRLARALLQIGRPAEARGYLAAILARGATPRPHGCSVVLFFSKATSQPRRPHWLSPRVTATAIRHCPTPRPTQVPRSRRVSPKAV